MRVGRLAAPRRNVSTATRLRLLLPAINYHCHREEPPLGGDVAISIKFRGFIDILMCTQANFKDFN